MGPDDNRFLWMLQMWRYGDRGYWHMGKDYGEKRWKQAARAQDTHATQLDHAGPQQGRSG